MSLCVVLSIYQSPDASVLDDRHDLYLPISPFDISRAQDAKFECDTIKCDTIIYNSTRVGSASCRRSRGSHDRKWVSTRTENALRVPVVSRANRLRSGRVPVIP